MITAEVRDWSEYDAMKVELETRARDLTASFHHLLNDLQGLHIERDGRMTFYKKLNNVAYRAMGQGRVKKRGRDEIQVRPHEINFWSGKERRWTKLDIASPEWYFMGYITYKKAHTVLRALQQYVMEERLLE